jgi:uncharacterized membrane protein YidH (DUF202 family)
VSVVLVVLGFAAGGRTVRTPERIVSLAGLAAASFMVMRLQAFLAVGTVMLAGPAVGRWYQRARRTRDIATERLLPPRLALATWCVTGVALVVTALNVTHLFVNRQLMPTAGSVAFLNTQPAGRVVVWFDWGEYAIWHLAPRMRVSIDGRRETTYSAHVQDQHLRFYFDADGGAALPAALSADYVWIPPWLPAAPRLDADGWRRVYEDRDAVVFVPNDSPLRQRSLVLAAAMAVGTDTFPGP